MELTAKLIQILPPQTGMGKNGEWKKQNIILETDGMYPKKVCFTLWGDKVDPSILQINTVLTVSFDAESREYNGNWYTDLRAWKVEASMDSPNNMPENYNNSINQPTPPPVDFGSDNGDDLPF